MASRNEKVTRRAGYPKGSAEPPQPSSVTDEVQPSSSTSNPSDLVKAICSVMINNLREEIVQHLQVVQDELGSLRERGQSTAQDLSTAREDLNQLLTNRKSLDERVENDIACLYDKVNNMELNQMQLSLATKTPSENKNMVSFKDNPEETSVRSSRSAKHPQGKRISRKPTYEETSESPDLGETTATSSSSGSDTDDNRRRRRSKRPSRSSASPRSKFQKRRKGPKHPGLSELKPTNELYRQVCSYRSYRLTDTSTRRSSRGTGKVRDYIKRMEIRLAQHHFSGSDPIGVLDFLSRFTREAEIQEMSEAQALLSLPHFLSGFARSQYEAAERVNPQDGGIAEWPEAVQYLLRNYAQNKYISSAIRDLRDTKQGNNETEKEYAIKLNNAVARCGNVHGTSEVITMFIDGLRPTIRSLVTGFREATSKASYLDVVDFASNHGDAVRAQLSNTPPLKGNPKGLASVHPLLALQEGNLSSSTSNMSVQATMEQQESLNILQQAPDASTLSTPILSQSETSGEQENLMALGAQRMVYGPRIPGQSQQQVAGWVDRQAMPRTNRMTNPRDLMIICHDCYQHGHISPKCTLHLRDLHKVVENYEKLTPQERSIVPSTSYDRVKVLFQPQAAQTHTQSTPYASAQGSEQGTDPPRGNSPPTENSLPKN